MNNVQPSYHERLNKVLRYIEQHLDTPPSIEELSRVACFSPYHFHRVFTAMVGESVAAYVRRIVLQRAAARLSYTWDKVSITELALDSGYDSVDAFTRAFRSVFGISPSRYRRLGGSLAQAQATCRETPVFYHLQPEVAPLNIEIVSLPRFTVAAYRYVGPYIDCGPAWQTLCGAFQNAGLLITEASDICSISHDDPDICPPEKCRMDVCVSLPEGLTQDSPQVQHLLENKRITLLALGGNKEYARIRVKGPYTLLHSAYRTFFGEWLPQSGRNLIDTPAVEFYRNCPSRTAPEDLITEIYIALQPAKAAA